MLEQAIQALVDLDAEHLDVLVRAAETFTREACLPLLPEERQMVESKMQLFCAVLAETRRNLHVIARGTCSSLGFAYGMERSPWAD